MPSRPATAPPALAQTLTFLFIVLVACVSPRPSVTHHRIHPEREVEGDVCRKDLGQGLGLRPGVYDGAISISALQWLCNAETSRQQPKLRLKCLFDSLYQSLARGARAVFQMYASLPPLPPLPPRSAIDAALGHDDN